MAADFSAVPLSTLQAILHEIEVTLRFGAYYKRIHLGGSVWLEVSALTSEEVYDLYEVGQTFKDDELTQAVFCSVVKRVVVGNQTLVPTAVELEDFWHDLRGLHHDALFFTEYQKIFRVFQDLHTFVPTFCDTPVSHMLHAWYVVNATRRRYTGHNSVEMLWAWLMRRYYLDVDLEHAKFVASVWSKEAPKVKTLVTTGLSWYHQYHNVKANDPLYMSVGDMEAMIERTRRGEKDDHDRAVEATEQAQRQAILDVLEREKAKAKAAADMPLPDEYTTF